MRVVGKAFTKVFGSRNDRLLKRYNRLVAQINALESQVAALTDEQLRARTHEIRTGIHAETIKSADVMAECFAIMRESMDRHIGIRNIFNPDDNFDPDKFNDELLQTYDEVQQRMIATGESWQKVPIPQKIYQAVRELYPESRPPFRARCFDVQVIGGLVLYENRIAEMATGEGKTFVGPLACFMKVMEGYHCHVVTVNDYLVRRDANWVRPAFENLGLTVGYLQQDMEPGGQTRKKMYECDVTYGMNSEFGFDFLRDNMKERRDLQVQGSLDYAIVDEVDSILIDEARTPLIISGPAHDDAPKYRAADVVARKVIELNKPWDGAEAEVDAAKRAIKSAEGDIDKFKKDPAELEAAKKRKEEAEARLVEAEKKKEGLTQYYEVELDKKSAHLTHEGIAAAQEFAGVGSFYTGNNMEWPHLMEQSLRAHVVYHRDEDYVVERGRSGEMEVIIVDEFTGRKMVGRQWSEGLHQSVEAKEKVQIKQESQTLATITLQNFFKLYKGIAGMTGTAQTEAEEFDKIYKLDVVTIPTNRPRIRADNEDRVYRSEREKWEAILAEIKEFSDLGRPVLVGTTSVEKSEMLSRMLKQKHGVEHEVLNAKNHEREASIVLLAGHQQKNFRGETVGNVTIATNMAGRGTDIKLSKEAFDSGGLHVIGTERHTARRIDNQLRGRSGRQGDPGSSRFYVSLQDDLMKMFAGEWTIKVLGFLGLEEGMAIEDKRISKGILRAQKKVEERNYLARKQLLEYDEVNDNHRSQFYTMRQRVLEGKEVDEVIWRMIGDAIEDAVDKFLNQDYVATMVVEWARQNFNVVIEPTDFRGHHKQSDIEDYIKSQARAEAETNIGVKMVEFMGEDPESVADWDTKGMAAWAMSDFHVQVSQNQLRQMTPRELEEMLKEAAVEQIENRDMSGLAKYVEKFYAEQELSNWAKEKFAIDIAYTELAEDAESRGVVRKPLPQIIRMIEERARKAYAMREVEYPVDFILSYVMRGQPLSTVEDPYAADALRSWAFMKYRVDLGIEHIRATPLRKLRDELMGYQEEYLREGKLEKDVDAIIAANPERAPRLRAFNERFGTALTEWTMDDRIRANQKFNAGLESDSRTPRKPTEIRDILLQEARLFFRRELTDLEQFVLIQIFDQSWKDHLYAMDMLRGGIGLQAFAEKDPRVAYKIEGHAYFQQMMAGVRDRVTDMIFRARIVGQTEAPRSNYREQAAVHETLDSYGVAENIAADNAVLGEPTPEPTENQEAVATKTIVREAPKVGRNDLCPCGSGKKFKKCCGVNVA
ncbi:MAG TPA: SEC-C metal-binding domain-containing protein [Tepidisphaeraceae bacterium]